MNSELLCVAGVEETGVLVEYPCSYDRPHSTEAVDLTDVERVVDFEAGDEALGLVVYRTPNNPYTSRCPQFDIITRRRHTNHARQHAIAQLVNIEVI